MTKLLLAATAALALVAAGSASAAVVYQSIPDLTVMPVTNGYCSECSANGGQTGQQFTLASSASISSVQFDVTNFYYWPSPVTLSVYADAGGDKLGAQLYTQTYSPSAFASDTSTAYQTDIVGVTTTGLTLAAGTYDLFLTNPSNLGIPAYGDSGNEIQVTDAAASPPSVGDSYIVPGNDAGLILQGNFIGAPEPVSIALLGVGLAGLGAIRCRRNKA